MCTCTYSVYMRIHAETMANRDCVYTYMHIVHVCHVSISVVVPDGPDDPDDPDVPTYVIIIIVIVVVVLVSQILLDVAICYLIWKEFQKRKGNSVCVLLFIHVHVYKCTYMYIMFL